MASIVKRPKKNGDITYQVKWRQDGDWQTENFGGDEGASQAEQFKGLVEAHGNKWPPGWIKGQGFVEPDTDPHDVPFLEWAYHYVDKLTGVQDRVVDDYRREIELHLTLLRHTTRAGLEVPLTIGNLTADDVKDWVRLEKAGEPDPADPNKWLRKPADPKSIANRHGLLSAIVQAAVDAEPPLRTKNCCRGISLPRVDNHTEDEMVFLERDEYQRVAVELWCPHARDLVDWLVGTGMRWGEATALQVRDFSLSGPVATVRVQRAWKRAPRGVSPTYYLGPPKTKKGRRMLRLSPTQAEMVRRRVAGKQPEALVFTSPMGRRWGHANFHRRRWAPAVQAAIDKGLPKRPRLHDLRHTHVSWLIAERIPLPAIQVRLGHESITTTVDRYGHLVQALEEDISTAIEAVMAAPAQRGLRAVPRQVV